MYTEQELEGIIELKPCQKEIERISDGMYDMGVTCICRKTGITFMIGLIYQNIK